MGASDVDFEPDGELEMGESLTLALTDFVHAALARQQNERAEPDERPDAHERLLLSVVEASEVLRVSRAFLYTLLASGSVPSVKVGRRRLIRWVDLVDFVDKLEVNQY